MDIDKLKANLTAERSRVLMGLKPDSKARSTWNRAIQAVADSVPMEYKEDIKAFMLEVRI
jgi:hypothetical protein